MADGVVSHLISHGIWDGGKKLGRRVAGWRYARIYGPDVCDNGLHLVYAALNPPVARTSDGQPVHHVFTKPGLPGAAFSMSAAVNDCELRAVKYLAESVAANTHGWTILTSDEAIADRSDLTFVSFGLTSNRKTVQLLENPANLFVRVDLDPVRFVSKISSRTILSPSQTEDYGVITKIHPSNLPDRTWICCGGFGEWGTSGAAWYLARKWRDLNSRFGKGPFVVIVRVRPAQDESAELVIMAGTSEELERQARGPA